MARTGRPKHALPRVRTTIYIDKRIAEAVDRIDYDPFLGRRTYANRNLHIEAALREYLEKYYPELAQKFLSGEE